MDDADWSPRSLGEARERIDAIDTAMLTLLHDRAQVVGHVGRLKRESGGAGAASAYRPAREVAMLRALHARTRDPLAFATVQAVWREIVSGFTAAQVPLPVHTVASAAPLARDTFGAQAVVTLFPSAAECLAAMRAMPGAVALLPATDTDWRGVVDSGGTVVAAAPYAGNRIEAWCVAMADPEPSGPAPGDDTTLALTGGGLLRHIPGFAADASGDTVLGAYPVPLKTGFPPP